TPLFNHFKTITADWTKIPEKHTDQYNQVNAISIACSTGVAGCEELTTGWFKDWMKTPENNTIHPNLRQTVYCSAIAAGGVEEWDFAWRMYREASIASEADKLMYSLACTRAPWLLNRYLNYCLDPEKIRKQDATFTIVYIAGNVVGQSLAWDFVRTNWNHLFNDYGGGSLSFARLIDGITRRFSSEFELKQVLEGIVESSRDRSICGSVGAVGELDWVHSVWDDGVDVNHDQPFKALSRLQMPVLRAYELQYREVVGFPFDLSMSSMNYSTGK
ncbi:aminopeptidase N-like, partial [Oncorhynchus masou masou]|uniref:aminopeptidase N-like n=1 Tax=Oncorhynchus masou masou TaxID=90313 RepID=UPI003183BCB5